MNRLEKIALATAILTTLLGVMGLRGFSYQYYIDQMLPGSLPMFVLGWVIATYGPLALAVTFWRLAKRFQTPLSVILHLLLLPCALAIFRAGDSMMVVSIGDPDFDATLGAPELPATLSVAIAILSYFAAALSKLGSMKTEQAEPDRE